MRVQIGQFEILVISGGDTWVRGVPYQFDWASVLRQRSWRAIAEIVFADNAISAPQAMMDLSATHAALDEIDSVLTELRDARDQAYYALTSGSDWTLEKLRSFASQWRNARAARVAKKDATVRRRSDFDRQRDVLVLKLLDSGRPYVCVVPGCAVNADLTVDHLLALSRGGSDDLENLQFMCRQHNSEKGDRDPPERIGPP